MVACGPPDCRAAATFYSTTKERKCSGDVSHESGILATKGTYGLGVLVADFDNDGWSDIYVAKRLQPLRFIP